MEKESQQKTEPNAPKTAAFDKILPKIKSFKSIFSYRSFQQTFLLTIDYSLTDSLMVAFLTLISLVIKIHVDVAIICRKGSSFTAILVELLGF